MDTIAITFPEVKVNTEIKGSSFTKFKEQQNFLKMIEKILYDKEY